MYTYLTYSTLHPMYEELEGVTKLIILERDDRATAKAVMPGSRPRFANG